MLIPRLFGWFSRKKKKNAPVKTTFDALRHDDTLYVDVSTEYSLSGETYETSVKLNRENLAEFELEYSKDLPIILFGNNKGQLNKMHDALEQRGFTKVFNVGRLEDLKTVKQELE